MSARSTTCKIVLRILLYTFLAVVLWGLLDAYRTIRTERVRTRLSMRMSEGEHELVVSLPSGHFQIHFAAEPNVGPASVVYYGRHMLPAVITTRLARRDGGSIVEPTTKEYITFSIEGDDAFRPQRLSVSITKTQDCQIYMNLAPGF